jgi:hypothetical protein
MYGLDISKAKSLLLGMKANIAQPLTFLPDGSDISALPSWVKTPLQVTDGHLFQLAKNNNAVLATLDKGVPGALLIPSPGD